MRRLLPALAVVIPLLLVLAGVLPAAGGTLSLIAVAALLLWPARRHAGGLLLVVAITALAMTVVSGPALQVRASGMDAADGAILARDWRSEASFDERLPVVLHVVLDEMAARGAMDPALPGAGETRAAIDRLAAAHGLRMFDSVYSRHYYSGVSIPNMMEAEYRGRHAQPDLLLDIQVRPTRNAYFDDVAARGYRTAVFQSALIDFCAPDSVDVCETFPSFDPAQVTGLGERSGPVFLADTFLRALEPSAISTAGRSVTRRWLGIDREVLVEDGVESRYDVEVFPTWFDRFVAFVSDVPRGAHVFAHFLVPHAPYLLSERCLPVGQRDSSYELGRRAPDRAAADRMREDYYQQYFAQVRCVVSKLDELFTMIARTPALADARVILHGDHGARISWGRVVEAGLEPRDLIDNYGTFFAVRDPVVAPGIDCQFTSLPQRFRDALTPVVGPPETVGGPPLPVLVASRAGAAVFVERPMPPFGCGAGPVPDTAVVEAGNRR